MLPVAICNDLFYCIFSFCQKSISKRFQKQRNEILFLSKISQSQSNRLAACFHFYCISRQNSLFSFIPPTSLSCCCSLSQQINCNGDHMTMNVLLCRPEPVVKAIWQRHSPGTALRSRHVPHKLHRRKHHHVGRHRLWWPDAAVRGAEEEDLSDGTCDVYRYWEALDATEGRNV